MIAKRFRVVTCALAVCATFGVVSAVHAAAFTNGDFEIPDIAGFFNQSYVAGNDIGGWTVVGGNVLVFSTGALPDFPPRVARNGSTWPVLLVRTRV